MDRIQTKLQSKAINPKRLKLHPIPTPNDRSIGVYYDRSGLAFLAEWQILTKIYVSAPYKSNLNSFRRAKHEEEERDKQIADQFKQLQKQINQPFEENAQLRDHNIAKQAELETTLCVRANLGIGNLLIDMARKLLAKEPQGSASTKLKEQIDGSTTRIQQLATTITDQRLVEAGVPTKYRKELNRLPSWVVKRNESAHDLAYDLAAVLSHPTMQDLYEQWAAAFPFVYGKTISQLIEEKKTNDHHWVGND
ncbi:hypothetical protein McanCB56680_006192 [Microsporum canis]